MASHSERLSFTGTGDLVFRWGYSAPRSIASGAGEFPAGSARLPIDPEGAFLVEVLDLADTVLRSDASSVGTWTYTAAQRAADGTDATSFKLRVTQQRDAYVSDPVTQTFVKT
jgi:hypothetical protein